jgi:hypothetical protein
MSNPYTVLGVDANTRTWNSEKGGQMIAYSVKFTEHPDKAVEWSRKASSDAPKVGDSVDGTIDWNAKFGPRFKQEFAGAKGSGTWKPRDPAEIAAIQRQAALKVSVQIAAAAGWWEGFDPLADASDDVWQKFVKTTDRVQRDIARGVKLAEHDARTAQSYGQRKDLTVAGGSDVPSDDPPSHPPTDEGNTPWGTAA